LSIATWKPLHLPRLKRREEASASTAAARLLSRAGASCPARACSIGRPRRPREPQRRDRRRPAGPGPGRRQRGCSRPRAFPYRLEELFRGRRTDVAAPYRDGHLRHAAPHLGDVPPLPTSPPRLRGRPCDLPQRRRPGTSIRSRLKRVEEAVLQNEAAPVLRTAAWLRRPVPPRSRSCRYASITRREGPCAFRVPRAWLLHLR